MKKFAKILIIAVFSLVIFTNPAAADTVQHSLIGTWVNELGSEMTINKVNPDGLVTGSYTNSAGECRGTFDLVGRTNLPSFGFVVSWTNNSVKCSSVTAWSGQLQKDKIVTTWLLTAQTTPANNWRSTTVNKDIFTRKPT